MPKYLDMHGLETLTGEIENTYLKKNQKGAAGGVATLDSNGKVPSSQIPSGTGGTTNYGDLTNKPQINGVTLSGNKTSANLGIADAASPNFTGSISMGRAENTTVGENSTATGTSVTASGQYSHAEGYGTTASENQAHAEGGGTTASGSNSHAEGAGSQATNGSAHAEGSATTASGDSSHSEGSGTTASGFNAHAEGGGTTASGTNSHAEGGATRATGSGAHAEGGGTQANADHAHAEGSTTRANGSSSHSEGGGTIANGGCAHAEGSTTQANGASSHAEGGGTVANGACSHVGGRCNVPDDYSSWAEWVANTSYAVGDKAKRTITENNETTVTGYICKTPNNDSTFDSSKWDVDLYMNYAEIIGNGSLSVPSNARTLDWDGNEELAGDLTLKKGTADEFSVSELKTAINSKQDAPSTAGTAGQVLALDSNLAPVWQTPSGGSTDLTDVKNVMTGDLLLIDGYKIGGNGKWEGNNNYSFYVLPVKPNDTILVKSNAYATWYTLLKDFDTPVSGVLPNYATGYSSIASGSNLFTITVPNDANYLVVMNQNGENNTLPVFVKNRNYYYLLRNTERYENSASNFVEVTSYPTNGYIDMSGVLVTGGTWKTSDYYPYAELKEVFVKAYQFQTVVALASFYDGNKEFVYGIDTITGMTGNGGKNGYLNLSSVPSTAKYVRFTANDASNSFAILKYKMANIVAKDNVKINEMAVNKIDSYVNITTFNSNGYIDMSGNIIAGANWVYTDFLNAKYVEHIKSKAYQIPGTVAIVAFYDNEKKFISAVDTFSGQTGSGNKEGILPVTSIPSNAVFMRFTCYASTADKYVRVKYNYSGVLSETTKELPDIKNDISELKSGTYRLYGYPFKMAFLGDSLTYGQTYVDDWGEPNFAYKNKANYPDVMCRMMDVDTKSVIALPGCKPKDLWNEKESDISNIVNQFVIVWLGTNGGLTDTVSVDCVGDDITQYANTETGYYGRIIQTLLTNGNRVFLAQVCYTNVVAVANKTIASLAERFSCGLIALSSSDIEDFNQNKYHTAYNGYVNSVHFNSIGYNHVAKVFYEKMMKIVFENPANYELLTADNE